MSNRELYNTWSDFYDTYPNPTVAIDDLNVPPFYAAVRDQRVLDIGCGTGRHSVRLVSQGCDVTGVDLSEGMLKQAKDKIGDSFTPVRADFFDYTTDRLFDFAIMSLALEHFPSAEKVFAHIAKLLRSGGTFLLTEIHPARSSKGTLAHFKVPGSDQELHLEGYSHSEESIRDACVKTGFTVEMVRDFTGVESLWSDTSRGRPEWVRYKDLPMLQMWVLKKI